MANTYGETNLKRRIGFLGLLAMSVGLNIGGSLFALTTLAAGMSGPSLPLAMLISSIPCLLAVIPYCILTSSLPTTAATYRYIQLISPALSLVTMLTLLVCSVIGAQPLFALAFGMYLQKIIPIDPIISGLLVLTFFYVINILGVELLARLQIILLFLLITALSMFVVLGLPEVEPGRFSVLFPNGIGGVLTATGLLFTFSAGGFFVIDMGGEVIQAKRVFPKVLFLGIFIVVIINILIMIVVVGVADIETLKGKSLLHVSEMFMSGPAVLFFSIGGALVACATTINVIFSTIARGLMVVARDGLLPKFLGNVNQRFGTPHFGLTMVYLVSAIALVSIPSLLFFGSMLNLGLIVSITLVAASGLFFPNRYPHLYAKSFFKVPPRLRQIACIGVIGINLLIFVFFTFAIGKATFVFFGIVVAASLYTLSKKKDFSSFDIFIALPELREETEELRING